MIKLVVSDIDGTLLPDGTDKINPEIFDTIRRLKERGILFAAASGRQYESMYYVFEPVAEDMIFIAENGSNVMCRGKNMSADYLDRGIAEELVRYIRGEEEFEILLSTPGMIYLEKNNPELFDMLANSYHNKIALTDDVIPYCANTIKIAVYCEKGAERKLDDAKKAFGSRLNVALSGEIWIDFVSRTADKGKALGEIQKILHIHPEETMAFGDNCNDIGMLGRAFESYAVANAHPQLKKAARYEAPPYWEDGVINTIRERLLKK